LFYVVNNYLKLLLTKKNILLLGPEKKSGKFQNVLKIFNLKKILYCEKKRKKKLLF